ncbi:UDP-N-acetylmuramoyl-L-alanine--D-glutamate ligase [Arsenicitalea aurantiaca]|uniref:UDP-N-acetylmuramoylalanine--D-glutamate ligase n=1 Tax=Arsenicitalea aurantiaca TaxID=1783274 RepID=A0A433XLJ9_9HYPH|nr:UDP-N-acetylmuramoyl-L-alanine--D-glutamate ligase [Arsenicitalea aurantiaca]RUT34943.1 UDP-N-acetylmuramoyl-L-alanine--D-glutamate ligase [Arsenicitalea aurantiaca]
MQLNGPVLLYGAGREARSTRAYLSRQAPAAQVFVTVDSGAADIDDATQIAPDEADRLVARGALALIVKSPGVPLYKPFFAAAREAGIPVTSNLNLWGERYRAGRQVIAITGTKGKSTTATLTQLMLHHSGVDTGLAGNVGLAPLEIADKHPTIVFELSSYQTADIAFSPDLAGLTNLYPEHVDWHGSVERYYADKLNLFTRGPVELALGEQDGLLARIAADLGPVRALRPLAPAVDEVIVDTVAGSRLRGAHNLGNARLAARLAIAAGATLDGIVAGVGAFAPLPHRLEEHRIGGLVFVNDSIATTPEATKAALAAYRGYRIALIGGGHERQQDYAELATLLAPHGVTTLVCLPVTGARLAEATRSAAPHIEVIAAADLEEGMLTLGTLKNRFDAVILSPGAPSYNQFKNFEERGTRFVALASQIFG